MHPFFVRRRLYAVAAVGVVLALTACEDKRTKELNARHHARFGHERSRAEKIKGGGHDAYPNVYDHESYFTNGKTHEVLYFTPNNEKKGKDTVAAKKLTPLVFIDNKLVAKGWSAWDSICRRRSTCRDVPLEVRAGRVASLTDRGQVSKRGRLAAPRFVVSISRATTGKGKGPVISTEPNLSTLPSLRVRPSDYGLVSVMLALTGESKRIARRVHTDGNHLERRGRTKGRRRVKRGVERVRERTERRARVVRHDRRDRRADQDVLVGDRVEVVELDLRERVGELEVRALHTRRSGRECVTVVGFAACHHRRNQPPGSWRRSPQRWSR